MHPGTRAVPRQVVPCGSQITGLEWFGNTLYPSATPAPFLIWNSVLSGTTPFPSVPATYIQKVYPRSGNRSYWSGLFHHGNTAFNTGLNYYGCHPYPNPDPDGPVTWEISAGAGDTLGPAVAPLDQWYTNVVIVSAPLTVDYYYNWPTLAATIQNVGTSLGEFNTTDRAIQVGNNSWATGLEVYKGIIRGLQFYDATLTTTQVQQEIDRPGSFRTPWYLNLNPTADDVTDKSGGGHHPGWVGTQRPKTWRSRE